MKVYIVVERIEHWYEESSSDPSEEIVKVFANRADAEAFAAEQDDIDQSNYSYPVVEMEVV
jgi:hypothetical protein